MIYTTFKQWVKGRFFASKDELALIETGWNYGYDAGVQWQKTQQALDKIADNERELNIQMQPEPVAWPVGWVDDGGTVFWKDKPPADGADLYTSPPQRTWVGLTDEEQQELYNAWMQKGDGWGSFYTLIEAKLRSKNT